MRRRFVVIALSICAFSSGSIAQVPAPSVREPELTASGHGETRLAPDYAYVTIGVTNQAQNAVDAASENVRRLESILGALHSFGLNDRQATEVSGVQFLASNTDDARRTAMTEAVRQARADADAMARAAGGTLGRLIVLNSGGISQPFYNAGGNVQIRGATLASDTGNPTTIVPGDLTVTAQVFGRWEFVAGPPR